MSEWLSRYNARKNGTQPRPPAPAPAVYPQQPAVQQAPPAYGPQPIPGAPPHAPFGYDQMTGQPMAPYGYHPNGAVALPPPPVQYQQPLQQAPYGPNGLPAPQGYGQPPYGPHGAPQPAPVNTWVDEQGQTHFDVLQAAASFQGGEGTKATGTCPECHKQTLVPRGAGNKKLNVQTGQMVDPAPECSNCGYNGIFTQMGSTGGAGDAAVKTSGPPRLAPGARTAAQAAHSHGLPNLFARD